MNTAKAVKEYLAGLPEDRRVALGAIRKVILKNLDADYREGMQYGMIGYFVPHSVFPAGYHCDPKQPLPFAGLASQKGHMALHLCCVYQDEEEGKRFREEWAKTGKKLDMGKACVRIKKLEDVPLEVIGRHIARNPARKFVSHYESILAAIAARKGSKKSPRAASGTKKSPGKKTARKKKE